MLMVSILKTLVPGFFSKKIDWVLGSIWEFIIFMPVS